MNHFDIINIQVQLASLSITLAASSTYVKGARLTPDLITKFCDRLSIESQNIAACTKPRKMTSQQYFEQQKK